MSLILKNISSLVTCRGSHGKTKDEMKDAGIIANGYIVIENEYIKEIGEGDGYLKYINNGKIII